ncbi:hypothetical protein HMPREF1991_02728 [Hoylesella loescheii DSM 19665 = JCM 12249 = ATCC 15930]|uniref:Uncharacterized protein n=1 Tax=Hoylesella loescheii DSM 19665 = JCM 12249 = ATCC 15930 TaxID=1122985 RepID=A0A069QEK7_HOYLO|nr:hypothetical protein HMPREF1991_02728 [Hoylesella loescheii DSM 19665 = JCM 12249 = ATCC 15930]
MEPCYISSGTPFHLTCNKGTKHWELAKCLKSSLQRLFSRKFKQ